MGEELNRVKTWPEDETLQIGHLPIHEQAMRSWAYSKAREDSHILDFFQGQIVQELECEKCHLKRANFEVFTCLDLEMNSKSARNEDGDLTLTSMLKEYAMPEWIEQKLKCPWCNKGRRHIKRSIISQFPKVLVIHFKRFKHIGGEEYDKLEDDVELANTVDLDLMFNDEDKKNYWG